MLFKRLILLCSVFLLLPKSHAQSLPGAYSFRHLGPFETPESDVDSGHWSSTGTSWVESLYVSPDGETLYAGTIMGGAYISTDGGRNWKLAYDRGLQLGVLDMEVRGKEWYIATGLTHTQDKMGLGVFCSKNKGRKWKTTGLSFELKDKRPIWCLEVSKDKKDLIAASPDLIYYSENKGRTWNISLEKENEDFRSLETQAENQVVLAGGQHLYRSEDFGKNWTDISTQLPAFQEHEKAFTQRIAIAPDPNLKGHWMVAYSRSNMLFIDESFDNGISWTNIYRNASIRGFDINHAELAIAPGNSNLVVIGGRRLYVSLDGGKSFAMTTFPIYGSEKFVHDDIRSVYILNDSAIYLGTDGGVFLSKDQGKTWVDLTGKGMAATMIYGLAKLDSGVLIGCQDLGYMVYRSGWTHLGAFYGDGGDALQIDDKVYVVLGGRLRALAYPGLEPTNNMAPPGKMHPFTAKLYPDVRQKDQFYFVTDHLWFWDGMKWLNKSAKIDNKGYKAIAFEQNKQDPSRCYFALDQPSWGNPSTAQKFFRSTDFGDTWEDISPNLPILNWKHITSICSNPKDPNEVYVSLGLLDDQEVNKVYQSKDGGKSWQNWSNGLPPYPTYKLQYIDGSYSGMLLGAMDGIYYRNAYMDAWVKFSGEMPGIAVQDFEIDVDDQCVYLGTYGNGMWKLNLSERYFTD